MSVGVQMNTYTDKILTIRGIPEAAVEAVIAKGRGAAIEGGKTLFQHRFADVNGLDWTINVICDGSVRLSSWIERV